MIQQVIQSCTQPFDKVIELPSSKSISNRALMLAALATGTSTLRGMLYCDDTKTCMEALRSLGINIKEQKTKVIIEGCGGVFPVNHATIQCNDSGIVLRFLLAICAMQAGEFQFEGSARLRERPLADLIKVLHMLDVSVEADWPPVINSTGVIKKCEWHLSGKNSSQFVSAMLVAAPLSKKNIRISASDLVSQPYVDMTTKMMAAFGVNVRGRYGIACQQSYRACHYTIEPDFSSASYFLAAAAITKSTITLPGLDSTHSMQGDKAFVTMLEEMGCKVCQTDHGLQLTGPDQLRGLEVDMRDCPDVFMTLAAIAPFASTPTTIRGVANARLKESDRIHAMAVNLKKCGIRVEEDPDGLAIYPGRPKAATLAGFNDHRIAMACSLLGLRVPGVVIDDAACVSKTFPSFFQLFSFIY